MDKDSHIPVMLSELIDNTINKKNGIYIDATLGRGGHAKYLLNLLDNDAKLLGWDRDLSAIEHISHSIKDPRLILHHDEFTNIKSLLPKYANSISGIYLDLGVSSPQLDDPTRGFSFTNDGPLDMRMNTSTGITAAEWLANVSEQELADTLYYLGEEPKSRRIARRIIETRAKKSILTTNDLSNCIIKSLNYKSRSRKHPATKTFQAIRIKINNELVEIENLLPNLLQLLAPNGRLAILTFHSLEDRIVKQTFKKWTNKNHQPACKWIIKKQRATPEEIKLNNRARSALLRVIEKIN